MNRIKQTTLDNGLRVVTDTIPYVESITLGLWVDVGTRDEDPAINGAAHMLEHMAFKGTTKRSAKQIAEEVEAVGGDMNAYTSMEITAYHMHILKNDLPLAVDIISDILQNSTFNEEEFAREQSVVIQEIGRSNDTPDDIVFEHFQATCFPNQPLGRPTLGTADIIRSLTPTHVKGFMDGLYCTEHMVFAAAGNVNHDHFVELAHKYFNKIPLQRPRNRAVAHYQGGDYRLERELEQVHLLMGFQGIPSQDPDYYTCSVLMTLLGGGMSSRLFQEIREKRGLVYSIYAYNNSYRDNGVISIYAGTGEKEVTELLPIVCQELKRLPLTLTETEIDRAKAQLKAGLLMALESTSSRCRQVAHQMLIYGRPLTTQEIIAKIDHVSAEQLSQLAERLFSQKPTLTALGPIKYLESYDAICARLQ